MSAKSFFSFVIGVAAGATAAWFLSTEKGQQTIADIKGKAAEGLDQLDNAVGEFKAKAEAKVRAVADTIEENLGK